MRYIGVHGRTSAIEEGFEILAEVEAELMAACAGSRLHVDRGVVEGSVSAKLEGRKVAISVELIQAQIMWSLSRLSLHTLQKVEPCSSADCDARAG